MIKRYFLFLLLLICSLGAANASVITVPDNCTTSDYYFVFDNDYTTDQTKALIAGYDFYWYTPICTGVDGNIIYFESARDLLRGLGVTAQASSTTLYGSAPTMVVYDGTPVTCTYYSQIITKTTGIDLLKDEFQYQGDSGAFVYDTSYRVAEGFSYVWRNSAAINTQTFYSGVTVTNETWGVGATKWDGGYDTNPAAACVLILGDGGFTHITSSGKAFVTWTLIYTVGCEVYTEPGTAVYEGSELLGTTDNAGYLSLDLPQGEHTFKLVKEGYWDTYETVTIADDPVELHVSLSPKNSIFQVSKEFSGLIYPNSVGTLSMDVNPVKDAYAAKLRISGVEVNKVYYKTQELPKTADGFYILGDVTSTQNIEIEFETPHSWGEKTFTVELTATDIEGTAYTNLEAINYEVLELPFLLEMPETFGIGLNDITLTDQSGTAYSVLMVLYDSEDVEVWSSSTNLLEYCDYTFEVPIEDADEYTIELTAKSGTVKTYYSVEIIEPVTLITEEITANPGKVATVQFKISNPTSSVKYYTAELTCPFLNESVNKTFSIAPETVDKTVDMSFQVPEGLELENYQLVLEIYDPDKSDPIFSGNIVLTISGESLIFASVPRGNTTIIILAAAILLIAGTFAALRLKK